MPYARFGICLALSGCIVGIVHGPVGAESDTPTPVTGAERLAWSQDGPDAITVAGYDFVALVDGVRIPLPDARCGRPSNATHYECEASLPPLAPGVHQITITTVDAHGILSEPSDALTLNVVPRHGGSLGASKIGEKRIRSTRSASLIDGRFCTTGGTDQKCFLAEVLATGLAEPRSLQSLPDGRLLFVNGDSEIRIYAANAMAVAFVPPAEPDGAVRVGDVAPAPDFERTRLVFLTLVRTDAAGRASTDILRAREVDNRLGEILIAVPDLPTSVDTRPALGVSADGRLYLAMPAGETGSSHASVYDGRVLRFEPDGRSAGQAAWPVIADGPPRPTAVEIDAAGRAWLSALNTEGRVPLRIANVTNGDRSRPSAHASAFAPVMRGWPDPATGLRDFALNHDPTRPELYMAPSGMEALLIATAARPSSPMTISELPLPNVEPTSVSVTESGVIFLGGVTHAADGSAAGVLMRLTPAR